jgi:hypothetical protein
MMENETKIWIRVIDGRRESVVIYLFFVARLSHTAQFAVWFSIVRVKPTVSRGFDDDRPECGPWWMRPGNSPPHVYPFQTLVLHYNLTFGHVSFILLLRGWKMFSYFRLHYNLKKIRNCVFSRRFFLLYIFPRNANNFGTSRYIICALGALSTPLCVFHSSRIGM